jgi:hypothetical protein
MAIAIARDLRRDRRASGRSQHPSRRATRGPATSASATTAIASPISGLMDEMPKSARNAIMAQ